MRRSLIGQKGTRLLGWLRSKQNDVLTHEEASVLCASTPGMIRLITFCVRSGPTKTYGRTVGDHKEN